jgi:excisionase family DNA binding protein
MKRTKRDATSAARVPSADLLTTKEVAALLRVHPKHVYRLMKRDLPSLRVGDEWRFNRDDVLRWAALGGAGGPRGSTSAIEGCPSLLAANGDLVIEVLLEAVRKTSTELLGFVQADHVVGTSMLEHRRVLACGQHVGVRKGDGADGSRDAKVVRLLLVTREIGLAYRKGEKMRTLRDLVGKRVATRPRTAGIRTRFDEALRRGRLDLAAVNRRSVEFASHRDVALAVARGEVDAGLTTHAWAEAAGLSFSVMGEEDYGLAFLAENIDDRRISVLCEVAQSRAFRRELGKHAGYSATRTGRVGSGE